MIQNILVAVIVAAALIYVSRRFYRSVKRTGSGDCGCGSGCGCAGGEDGYRCHTFDKYFLEDGCRQGSRRADP